MNFFQKLNPLKWDFNLTVRRAMVSASVLLYVYGIVLIHYYAISGLSDFGVLSLSKNLFLAIFSSLSWALCLSLINRYFFNTAVKPYEDRAIESFELQTVYDESYTDPFEETVDENGVIVKRGNVYMAGNRPLTSLEYEKLYLMWKDAVHDERYREAAIFKSYVDRLKEIKDQEKGGDNQK